MGAGSSSIFRDFLRRLFRNRLAAGGGIVIALLFVVAAVPSLVTDRDPNRIDILRILAPPSAEHPLGTDELGRDVLSRMVHGGRISLEVGFVATGIATAIGLVVGLIAGFYGRGGDGVLMRFVCITVFFPSLL